MPGELLPLFPLETVLLPGALLPLHIFEGRYQEMIGDALRHHTEFGIILAHGEMLAESGCTASVVRILQRYSDGRFDILVSGERRFEILAVDDKRNYLRAEVDYFDDDEPEEPDEQLLRSACEAYGEFCRLAGQTEEEIQTGARHPSFVMGRAVPEPAFRQRLLITRSENARLRLLADFMTEFNQRIRKLAEVKQMAGRNGREMPKPE